MKPGMDFRPARRLSHALAVAALAAGFLIGHVGSGPASAAGSASAFDGVYVGDLGYGTANTPRSRCTTDFPNVHMRVSNGTVSMSWNGQLTGTISPDGTVLMEATNGVKVSGTIAGNAFNGTGHGVYCTFKMNFTKQ